MVNQIDIEVPDFAGTIDYGDLDAGFFADSWEIVQNGLIQCIASTPVDGTPLTRFGIVFSDAVDFFVDGNMPDVMSVALHETGHNAGLGHVSLGNYAMHRVVDDFNQDLQAGDISGGQHVVKVSEVDIVCTVGQNNISFPGIYLRALVRTQQMKNLNKSKL